MSFYRRGKQQEARFCFSMPDPLPIRQIFPDFEKVDYEILGGMVVMSLSFNHINILEERGLDMGAYRKREHQYEGRLLISNIFQNSPVQEARVLEIGDILVEINGIKIHTLDEFRIACQKDVQFLRIKAENGRFCVLSLPHVLETEARLIEAYHYQSTGLCALLQKQSSGL